MNIDINISIHISTNISIYVILRHLRILMFLRILMTIGSLTVLFVLINIQTNAYINANTCISTSITPTNASTHIPSMHSTDMRAFALVIMKLFSMYIRIIKSYSYLYE